MPYAPATSRREPYPQTVGRPGFSGRSRWSACGGQRLRALQRPDLSMTAMAVSALRTRQDFEWSPMSKRSQRGGPFECPMLHRQIVVGELYGQEAPPRISHRESHRKIGQDFQQPIPQRHAQKLRVGASQRGPSGVESFKHGNQLRRAQLLQCLYHVIAREQRYRRLGLMGGESYPQTVGRPGFSGRNNWSACGGQRLRALHLARAGRFLTQTRVRR